MNFFPYDPVECVEKEIYTIRLKDGRELPDYYPNGEGFHRTRPHADNPARVPKTDVTHVAFQAELHEHYKNS